jgi:hypothetical protein
MNKMKFWEADQLGYREATTRPILIFGLYGICAGVAWKLTIRWYWKIAAFLAMSFTIALARILFGVITGSVQLNDD